MNLQSLLQKYWVDAHILQMEYNQDLGRLSILFASSSDELLVEEARLEILREQPMLKDVDLFLYAQENLLVLLKYYLREQPMLYQCILKAERLGLSFILPANIACDLLIPMQDDINSFLHLVGYDQNIRLEKQTWEEVEKEIEQTRENNLKEIRYTESSSAKNTEVKLNKYTLKPSTVQIADILSQEGHQKVIIEGELVHKETKLLNSGNYLMNLSLYDGTGTIGIKSILSSKDFQKQDEELTPGNYYCFTGSVQYDTFSKELLVRPSKYKRCEPALMRQDQAKEKRVELSVHTAMSETDGVQDFESFMKRAKAWDHKAIALTDLNSVHAYPGTKELAQKLGLKVIYGIELKTYEKILPVEDSIAQNFRGEFVVFDIESTGLNPHQCELIEIGAVRLRNLEVVDTFQELIKPKEPISAFITELTGISNEMVAGARSAEQVLPEFYQFIGNVPLVAHNVAFDYPFLKRHLERLGFVLENPRIDTLSLSQLLLKDIKRFKLNQVAKHLKINQEHHHRAMDDAFVCAKIFVNLLLRLESRGVTEFAEVNHLADTEYYLRASRKRPVTLLAKEQAGIEAIYRLLSDASIYYLDGTQPCLPFSELDAYRKHLLIGSSDADGLLYDSLLSGAEDQALVEIAQRFDYIEIQPIGVHLHLLERNIVHRKEGLIDLNLKLVDIAQKAGRPLIATSHARYLDPEDHLYRNIVRRGQKRGLSEEFGGLYLRTTDEMLKEFSYLEPAKAYEIVVTNPNRLVAPIEQLAPYPEGKFPPFIEGAEQLLREMCLNKAFSQYGNPLPKRIADRLEFELRSIINNGFAVLYIIAEKLVHYSKDKGYLVGSRGSVGSSFAATMCGITEVNPLAPHYYCSPCSHVDFEIDSKYDNGFDMPDKVCPHCHKTMKKDGFRIPFESFMGFEGNKEPDIDLNFSPAVQGEIHRYVEELFGKGHVFKAGTISKVADRIAFGYIKHYFEEEQIAVSNREIERIAQRITGIRRSSGQHPGGIIVLPKDRHVCEFTPIQYPANDSTSGIITTHFDYHAALEGRLFKLDILGHDVPSMIHDLEEMTGVNVSSLPFDDPKIIHLFNGVDQLELKDTRYPLTKGTLAIPEFGTTFVRGMLEDTRPGSLADLIRISGLSHGTNVWVNNAQELIRRGTHTIKDVLATREEIMYYGIDKGWDRNFSFQVMEKVRKGRKLSEADIDLMKQSGVDDWFLESCDKISYMFPKAHAVAYVLMSYRIAYFKVYHPLAFYAAYFCTKIDDFDAREMMKEGIDGVLRKIKEITENKEATQKEQNQFSLYEVVYEMYARGFEFAPICLKRSHAKKFVVEEGRILPPLQAIQGVAESAALNIVRERELGPFLSVEDLQNRAKLNRNAINALSAMHCLEGLSESNQLDLFSLL